ncbi:MAG: DUF2490 domain-containing protein [Mucilaginibacter polytrichastri]|nr:DUF2490 domain-containing protein [Mucilaginibacter polytrichastri]
MHHILLRILPLCSFLVFLSTISFAQNNRFVGWAGFFNTTKLGNSQWTFQFDGQFRTTGDLRHVNQIMIRPALLYNFNKQHNLGVGYGIIPSRSTAGTASGLLSEHRIFQQYIYKQKIGTINLDHRFRTEERFTARAQNVSGEVDRAGNRFSGRVRYFFRTVLPLAKTDTFNRGVFASLQNEIFFNVLRLENVNGKNFDQNRAYASFGYRFSKAFDTELGYMHQFIKGGNAIRQQNNHILQVAFYTRF